MQWKPPNLGITAITGEALSPGHPDVLADTLADAILDACLGQDRASRLACDVIITDKQVVVAGEISSRFHVQDDIADLFKRIAYEAGYRESNWDFDAHDCEVQNLLREVTPFKTSADPALVLGYACAENRELLPLPVLLAQRLMQCHGALVRSQRLPWLGPDAQTQVTVLYQDGRACAIDRVVLTAQHQAGIPAEQCTRDLMRHILKPILPASLCDMKTQYLINPAGPNHLGGPAAHTGRSGRSSPVITYGNACAQEGDFCGKDPRHLKRSGAYMARYLAKHMVGAGLAAQCTVQLNYIPNCTDPADVIINTRHTSPIEAEQLLRIVKEHFDLTPAGIIHTLALDRPIYRPTAMFGHFGRLDPGFTWERLDHLALLREACDLTPKPSLRNG